MAIFSKESLETLRQRIDLVEVLSTHVDFKHSGASYKATCPFHDEKTPSFVVQKGDSHYHCFGCGAHGDAIQFLMSHVKMNFIEAVEHLAQRFHVQLQQMEGTQEKGSVNKTALKEALEQASRLYHFLLLHTPEGHEALHYLYSRGIDLDFIHQFQIGLAPKASGVLRRMMQNSFKDEILAEAGLLTESKDGRWRDFFYDRITIPIRDGAGAVIGFSARKYKNETTGGKYINTPETPLFKKSRVLFGMKHSRRRIAKERKAIIVEGQVDALRLIQEGFNITVASQGTAFGEGHAKELLNLGVNQVYLALDSDEAGKQAACKIGDLFQKEGVEVKVINLPKGSDPDSYIREKGPAAFLELMEKSSDYLTFLVSHLTCRLDIGSPAGKNELVQIISKQIRNWDHPLVVHESLRKLANLTNTPESILGVGQDHTPNLYIKKSASIGQTVVDPDRILESDVLRWLLVLGGSQPQFTEIARLNLQVNDFRVDICRQVYQLYLENPVSELLTLALNLNDAEGQLFLSELLQKKINKDRAEQQYVESIQKVLDRNWMEQREVIKRQIQSGQCSDEEASTLLHKFDDLKKNPPKVKTLSASVKV